MGSELLDPRGAVPELIVRLSRGNDPREMAPRLRTEDIAEVVAASGQKPVDALIAGYELSKPAMTVEYRGRPAAMFGIVPSQLEFPRLGNVWLLGTNDINLFSREFLRQSRFWLTTITQGFDIVGNVVDERNLDHARWLKWLGFKFIARHEHFGHLGLPFLEFVIITENIKSV